MSDASQVLSFKGQTSSRHVFSARAILQPGGFCQPGRTPGDRRAARHGETTLQPGGLAAVSRRLSEAIPPVRGSRMELHPGRVPAGVAIEINSIPAACACESQSATPVPRPPKKRAGALSASCPGSLFGGRGTRFQAWPSNLDNAVNSGPPGSRVPALLFLQVAKDRTHIIGAGVEAYSSILPPETRF